MNGVDGSQPDPIDARIARLVELLGDRDQQLADRLVVTDLAARLDRAETAMADLLARAVTAEEEALAAAERVRMAERNLADLQAWIDELAGPSLAAMGVKRSAREFSRRWTKRA